MCLWRRMPPRQQSQNLATPLSDRGIKSGQVSTMIYIGKIVAAFRGMHVSPAKQSYVWLQKKKKKMQIHLNSSSCFKQKIF